MRIQMVEQRIGENMGPIDWQHEIVKDMPLIWREAESNPSGYFFNGRPLIEMGMYDGWPYWTPRPAVLYVGPLNSAEWTFFDSYSVRQSSIVKRADA